MEPRIVHGRSDAALCDFAAARRAIELSTPLLASACRDRTLGESGYLHIVIMNPLRAPTDSAFEDAILLEASFGEDDADDALYAGFARAKARLSWRVGRDGFAIQHGLPQCLRAGDTTLGGGVWLDGIVVAASGCHAVYDEALSGAVAMCLRGVLKARAEARRQAGDLYFHGQDVPQEG